MEMIDILQTYETLKSHDLVVNVLNIGPQIDSRTAEILKGNTTKMSSIDFGFHVSANMLEAWKEKIAKDNKGNSHKLEMPLLEEILVGNTGL